MASTEKSPVTNCPKCGTEFTCNPAEDCWCVKLSISKENLEFLKNTYSGCLCPECLKEFQILQHETISPD